MDYPDRDNAAMPTGANHLPISYAGYRFSVEAAVCLFSQKTSDITALWGIYVNAALLAAAFSYGLSQAAETLNKWSPVIAIPIMLGYFCFMYGHLRLVRQAMSVKAAVGIDLKEVLLSVEGGLPFLRSLTALTNTVNPLRLAVGSHLLIDCCVIIAIGVAAYHGYHFRKMPPAPVVILTNV